MAPSTLTGFVFRPLGSERVCGLTCAYILQCSFLRLVTYGLFHQVFLFKLFLPLCFVLKVSTLFLSDRIFYTYSLQHA